jgi:Ca-activated chloride channel homolog
VRAAGGCAFALLASALVAPRAHAADGALEIVSPRADQVVSGPVTFKVDVEPQLAERVLDVRFSIDGDPACRAVAPELECRFDAGPSAAPRQIRAVARLRGGGRLVASLRSAGVDMTLSTSVELVQVTATVTDRKGRLVRDLQPEDFRVFEDGARQEISEFVPANAPREIVVAVDMSGSMAQAMPKLRDAVQGFLASLRGDDHVTLVAFNDALFTLARRETDAAARARAVARLAAWGGTALYDAILKGLDLLDKRRGRKALVVFTDGDDTASRATLDDVQRRAERSDAPVYAIGQGRGAEDASLRSLLGRITRMSGGRAFATSDPDELREVFATISLELSSQYLLAYASDNPRLDGSWREIRVEAGPGRSVRARQGYRAEARP